MYSTKKGQATPRPLGMKLETTSALDSKSIRQTKSQNRDKHPNIPWHLEKGKARLKTIVITRKNHATDMKRTIHQHANPCMSKPARKSHMHYVTCKYSCWSYLILLFISWYLLSFLSLFLLFLPFSKARVLKENFVAKSGRERIMGELQNWIDQNLTLTKTTLTKPTLTLISLLSIRPLFSSISIIFLHFLLISNLRPFTLLFS